MDPVLTSGNMEYEEEEELATTTTSPDPGSSVAGIRLLEDPGYPTLPGSAAFGPLGPKERLFWPVFPCIPCIPCIPVLPWFPVFRVFRVFRIPVYSRIPVRRRFLSSKARRAVSSIIRPVGPY